MVITSIPLSTIPVAPGDLTGLVGLVALVDLAAPLPAAGKVRLTMAGAGAGMEAAATPAVVTGSPESLERPERPRPIEAGRRHPTGVVHPLTGTGEDKC
jgi:hypothetical protein